MCSHSASAGGGPSAATASILIATSAVSSNVASSVGPVRVSVGLHLGVAGPTGLDHSLLLPEATGPEVRLLTWTTWGVSSSSASVVAIALYPASVRWTGSVPNNLSSFSGSASQTSLK